VAVDTGQVAELSDVDLENFRFAAMKRFPTLFENEVKIVAGIGKFVEKLTTAATAEKRRTYVEM
jgi:hypothetical protein